jgi:hypothetical protein
MKNVFTDHSGSLSSMHFTPDIIQLSQWICQSYKHHLGVPLLDCDGCNPLEITEQLHHAPFVVLAHDENDDPTFNYANLAGQYLWEMEWAEFTRLRSRFSADLPGQEERLLSLEEARRKGFIQNYQGVRISRSGRRFTIKDATLWNVYNDSGIYAGQAVMFERWEFLSARGPA